MKRNITIGLAILTILLFFVQNAVSVPKKIVEPAFSALTVTTSKSHLLLFASLTDGFTEEMIQGLHSGLPLHFSFFIELEPTDKKGKDDTIATIETRHILSYDTLKESYKVEIEESSKRFFSFQSLQEAQKTVEEINGIKVVELARLTPDISYSIRMKAELYKKTLPMGLHEVVPFVSWWDIRTKWHSITFTL